MEFLFVYGLARTGGAPQHPGWYRNLVKHPDVELQVLADRLPALARTATSEKKRPSGLSCSIRRIPDQERGELPWEASSAVLELLRYTEELTLRLYRHPRFVTAHMRACRLCGRTRRASKAPHKASGASKFPGYESL